MKRVTIRVPATTANLGPGFDAFGCALSLSTDVTFEEMEDGLEITGCPKSPTFPFPKTWQICWARKRSTPVSSKRMPCWSMF